MFETRAVDRRRAPKIPGGVHEKVVLDGVVVLWRGAIGLFEPVNENVQLRRGWQAGRADGIRVWQYEV